MRFSLLNQQQNFQQNKQKMHIKLNRTQHRNIAIVICLLVAGITKTNAVPTDNTDGAAIRTLPSLHRALREVAALTSNLMQESELRDTTSTEITMDQPQGQCLLDGILVSETTVYCEKQVGCRAIQKTGHCCPDYKCDCEKDGKTYLNGDKLVDPETPCTVCYCQGGEILCSSVTCFHRDDCKPKYIVGRCCPEYDNCPVLSPSNNNNSVVDIPTNPFTTTTSTSTTIRPEIAAAANNPKITIKEITKRMEIRITNDNKAIPIPQMLKPNTPSTSTTTMPVVETSAPTSLAAQIATTTPAVGISTISTITNLPTLTTPAPATTTTAVGLAKTSSTSDSTEISNKSSVQAPASNDVENSRRQTLLPVNNNKSTESLKLSASVAYPTTGSELESFDEKPLAAFVGQNGLQGESETTNDANKVNIKRENLLTTSVANSAEQTDSLELIFPNESVRASSSEQINGNESAQAPVELEPDTAGSDNIYHIILTTDGPRTSEHIEHTESYLTNDTISTEGVSSPTAVESAFVKDTNPLSQNTSNTKNSSTESPIRAQSSTEPPCETLTSVVESTTPKLTDAPKSTTFATDRQKVTTDDMHHAEDEDTVVPMESNPAYPSLPEDDFSLRDVNFPLTEAEDIVETDNKDEHRHLHEVPYETPKSTKHLDTGSFLGSDGSGSGGGSGNGAELIENNVQNGGTEDTTTETLYTLPKRIELMYSMEDNSAETTISNGTNFQLQKIIKDTDNETGSGIGASLEIESADDTVSIPDVSSGSGNGSEDMNPIKSAIKKKYIKSPEPTTPRTRIETDLDIDELSNEPALREDPKLDAESLKLHESAEDDAGKSGTAVKGNILAVEAYPIQERAAEEIAPSNTLVGTENSGRIQRLYLHRIF
ncbi:mucin-5AC [Teleopsis dalmanni]|uniref:mucin-5AC n=1 Tax=Teleopsis dalmanni TaxID=139649 RepID=UPI0018CC90CC|nr:mucin-5AC [Teleopsis dalmanni]